jgi:hypothetical protein
MYVAVLDFVFSKWGIPQRLCIKLMYMDTLLTYFHTITIWFTTHGSHRVNTCIKTKERNDFGDTKSFRVFHIALITAHTPTSI